VKEEIDVDAAETDDHAAGEAVDGAADDEATNGAAADLAADVDDAAAEYDELPDDLDITGLVGPYEFPNNAKRRIASILYLVIGAICIWLGAGVDSALVNGGLVVVGIGLVAFAVYSYAIAVDTAVEETDALVIAAKTVGFVPGHASAQMSWRGWRSRPEWRILVYSDEEQPEKRAIVLVDGVSGDVREHFVEDNPEDWSDLIAGV
jgi:hypothetical protein